MFAASRRIYVYWLLLLLPTLAVGAGALLLLRREQARLAERSADAIASRQASVAARAQLTVETIELLIGDVQSGLLDNLVAEPAEGLETFLNRWERENPLVRTAFRVDLDGEVRRPDARTATEDGRAFLRWFTRQFGAQPPWTVRAPAPEKSPARPPVVVPAPKDAAAKLTQAPEPAREIPTAVKAADEFFKQRAEETEVRNEIGRNVAQVQQARRDVQDLVKTPSYSNSMSNLLSTGLNNPASQSTAKASLGVIPPAAPSAAVTSSQAAEATNARARPSSSFSSSSSPQVRREVQELLKPQAAANPASTLAQAPPSAAPRPLIAKAETAEGLSPRPGELDAKKAADAGPVAAETAARLTVPLAADSAVAASAATPQQKDVTTAGVWRAKDTSVIERRAWQPVNIDGRLHLVGWVQLAGVGEVRGVEVNLTELVKRFGGALPASVSAGEGYALRDEQGRVMHVVGAAALGLAPASRVPLASALLPGWEVVGFLSGGVAQSESTTNFVWVSTLLVGVFLLAILAGGSLLLWQARRSEAEAAQKTSFVANVSHEFKTPLTTIRLYAELLEQGRVRDAAQGGDYLRTIARETQRLARLVNNALDFSRLEQGKKKFARESLDLATELTRLLDTHEPRLAECGLNLRRELPAGPVPTTTDRDAFEQIVLNLLDNAVKYAAEGGEVTVVLSARTGNGAGAELRVQDRGPGVPAEHRERIFEKFHRVDDTLTAEKSGAGLGLSIARQLARGLGGDLHYAPRAGGGAGFILSLP